MIAVAALVWAATAPSVHVEAPAALRAEIVAALARERPQLQVVDTATAAALVAVIRTREGTLELTLGEGAGPRETRPLGALDGDGAALRRAVLLIVQRLDEVGAGPSPAVERSPDAPRPIGSSSARDPAGGWRLELGPSILMWSGARLGVAAAAARAIGPVDVGARALARGLCCVAHGDNIDADAWAVAALVEGAWRWPLGPLGAALLLGVGPSYERLDAIAVDVFVGQAGAEPFEAWSVLVRPAARVDVGVAPSLRVALTGGVEIHGGDLAVRLPAAFAADRAPLERPAVSPFVELTLGFEP